MQNGYMIIFLQELQLLYIRYFESTEITDEEENNRQSIGGSDTADAYSVKY